MNEFAIKKFVPVNGYSRTINKIMIRSLSLLVRKRTITSWCCNNVLGENTYLNIFKFILINALQHQTLFFNYHLCSIYSPIIVVISCVVDKK